MKADVRHLFHIITSFWILHAETLSVELNKPLFISIFVLNVHLGQIVVVPCAPGHKSAENRGQPTLFQQKFLNWLSSATGFSLEFALSCLTFKSIVDLPLAPSLNRSEISLIERVGASFLLGTGFCFNF